MVKKEEKVKTLRETIQVDFNLEEGPCIMQGHRKLPNFIWCVPPTVLWGNICGEPCPQNSKGMHVQCFVVMMPANVDTLCSCVLKATEKVPELKLEAVAVHQKFHTILMQFSECHVLFDNTVLTQDDMRHLGKHLIVI